VITEVGPDGLACVPVFYRGRIYFNFEAADRFETAYEELLRWLVDKPQFVKPKLGSVPAHVTGEAQMTSALVSRGKRAEDALRNGRDHAAGLLREFNEGLRAELGQIQPKDGEEEKRGDNVLEAVALMRPYVRQFQDLLTVVLRFTSDARFVDELLRGLESLSDLMARPEAQGPFTDDDRHRPARGSIRRRRARIDQNLRDAR
jgi:hypothetical protein